MMMPTFSSRFCPVCAKKVVVDFGAAAAIAAVDGNDAASTNVIRSPIGDVSSVDDAEAAAAPDAAAAAAASDAAADGVCKAFKDDDDDESAGGRGAVAVPDTDAVAWE